MDKTTFEARLAQTGLKPSKEDLPALQALVTDLDRAAGPDPRAASRIPKSR